MKRLLVVQRRLTHYRVPFFESLRAQLARDGVELILAHGEGTSAERAKRDAGELAWAEPLPTRYLLDGRLCWQPFESLRRSADMVVVTAENKLLANMPLQWFAPQRVALWGHGANLQGSANSLRERFKRRQARLADWWFAYTELSVPLITAAGFPADRVSVLDNTIDTSALQRDLSSCDVAAREAARLRMGLSTTGPVGLFLGSLYADKRIDMLLSAADRLRLVLPDFQLLVVGDGPDRDQVQSFCAARPWARAPGALRGPDKAAALSLATVMLNPGLVGLGILDSFVAAVPLVTTQCGLHSPEVAYLRSGENGLMTSDDLDAFVAAARSICSNADLAAKLREGCRRSASRYTLDHMAAQFSSGVRCALESPPYRRAAGAPLPGA